MLPALARGEVVITDRYVDSTLAYQGAGPRPRRRASSRTSPGGRPDDLRPHLTVVLDLEPASGLGRFEGRDRIEGESMEFHERVRAAFLAMAGADPDHYLVLDARLPVDEIAAAVREPGPAAARPGQAGRVVTVWDGLVGQRPRGRRPQRRRRPGTG